LLKNIVKKISSLFLFVIFSHQTNAQKIPFTVNIVILFFTDIHVYCWLNYLILNTC